MNFITHLLNNQTIKNVYLQRYCEGIEKFEGGVAMNDSSDAFVAFYITCFLWFRLTSLKNMSDIDLQTGLFAPNFLCQLRDCWMDDGDMGRESFMPSFDEVAGTRQIGDDTVINSPKRMFKERLLSTSA